MVVEKTSRSNRFCIHSWPLVYATLHRSSLNVQRMTNGLPFSYIYLCSLACSFELIQPIEIGHCDIDYQVKVRSFSLRESFCRFQTMRCKIYQYEILVMIRECGSTRKKRSPQIVLEIEFCQRHCWWKLSTLRIQRLTQLEVVAQKTAHVTQCRVP